MLIMKKQTIALLIAFTIIFSGVAGFGGTYLANTLTNVQAGATFEDMAEYQELTLPPGEDDVSEWDTELLNAYLDEYIGSLEIADILEIDTSLLNSSGTASTSQSLSIPEIAALTSNSIVEIYTETVSNSGRMGQFVTEGAGSGVIITSDGYVVTNNHVIEGAKKISVRLKNGGDYDATMIGRDSKTDLAIVKINATGLQPAVYGDSDKLVVGELAVAIGNPLGQLGGTVTEGIISALSRNIEIDGHMMALLQTSAAVNPGNSGGGLFNGHGELIGIVNAKSSGSDIEGIGFAIPANLVKSIAADLIQYGYVPGRIDFGATLIDILDARTAMMYRVSSTGVYVSQADSDSSFKSGDRIISIGDKEIKSTADVNTVLESHKVSDILSITVARNGSNTTVNLTLKQAKS